MGDDLLGPDDLVPVRREAAGRTEQRALAELADLIRQNRWADVVDLFHPVEEKLPELADYGHDIRVREKIAFALGHLGRHDEAITELSACLKSEPDNFFLHASLAYTAYDSLWAAKNRQVLLSGKARNDRIALAHRHFAAAQALRPDTVTNFYRQGMLFREIEGKDDKSIPLFRRAVENWEGLEADDRQRRHQERKNYIKSLYQLAGALVAVGRPDRALGHLQRCLAEDESTNYIALPFKYFALGKVQFHLNSYAEARDALLFAAKCRHDGPLDFVFELLARVYLALGGTDKAREAIGRVPEARRRPYIRWTEADVLCAAGEYEKALQVLTACVNRDGFSRHKGLLRMARITYLLNRFDQCAAHAEAARRFFREKWTNDCNEGVFWLAAANLRQGRLDEAGRLAGELETLDPRFPRLDRLKNAIGKQKK
ncbi:MAG: tetratricopeptide repeat protein [Desulfobacteraceae bacterium]|nr:tetratricopeptide repeat protein [Desulfobacteraceae bacterium]